MTQISTRLSFLLLGVFVGIGSYFVSSYITKHYFLVGWFNLIPWIIGGLIVGYFSLSKKDIIVNGALYGYFLFLSYILTGYIDKSDTTGRGKMLIMFILFSLVGGIAGIIGAFIGNFLRRKLL